MAFNFKGARATLGSLRIEALRDNAATPLEIFNQAGTSTFSVTAAGNITNAGTQAVTGAFTVTSANANALAVGPNGTTNPVLQIDASTASAATGIAITGAAAAAGVAVAVVSSGTNENLTFDAKGSGTVTFGATSTGNIVVAGSRTLVVTTADLLTVGGVIVPQFFYITFAIAAGAADADYDGVIPVPDAAEIVSVTERHAVLGSDGGAVTLMVEKTPSGTARGAGTDTLSAGINMKGTADTNAAGSLHATAANYQFAAGDGVSLVLTGTGTAVDGVGVTVKFKRI